MNFFRGSNNDTWLWLIIFFILIFYTDNNGCCNQVCGNECNGCGCDNGCCR